MEETKIIKKRLNQDEVINEMINNILENFDFSKCRMTMRALNWTWYGRGIPTIEMMKEQAKNHLKRAIDGCLDREEHKSHMSPYFCSSGGLKATAMRNKYYRIEFLELEFVLTEWNTDLDLID